VDGIGGLIHCPRPPQRSQQPYESNDTKFEPSRIHVLSNVAFSRALQRGGCNALFGGIVMRRNPG
jgi:hypothetical protein